MDFNQNTPISTQTSTPPVMPQQPVYSPEPERPAGKIVGIFVALIVVLAVLAIVYVLARNSAPAASNVGGIRLTDAEKAQILQDLQKQAASAPVLSDVEKAKILSDLQKQAASAPVLSEAEKAKILQDLQKASQ